MVFNVGQRKSTDRDRIDVRGKQENVMSTCQWFAPGSLSFEFAKGLPAAFVALVIGVIAAWIAFQQWRVARAKLNLDLFERRLSIYRATDKYLLESLSGGPQGFLDSIEGFDDASFLFGSEVTGYLREVLTMRHELRDIDTRAQANSGMVQPHEIGRHQQISQWLIDQRKGACRVVFAQYLDFGRWR